ncbi:potassium channel family protein [Collinsella tanakaei]|uniref:potassium channel family protein n=1 Tax=Collinsella tanakaei TaxID=626935 RepID=UPI0025A349A1|nr:TrkA family potassium uptake protein [Collinsella tanakaei]MDM8300775.1 TrkA family potassium uptake protein [Collinsella tanakaei]
MQIIIAGGGKVGAHLASQLCSDGETVTIIENQREKVARLRRTCPECTVIEGSATDPLVLERAGIHMADVLAVVTGKDEVNLVIAMLGKMEFAVPRVISRVNDPSNAWMFTPVNGVDVAINQAEITVRFIHEGMNLRDMFTLMKLGRDEHSIVQATVNPGAKVDGAPLADIAFPAQTIVVAVERGGNLTVPNGRTVLRAGDEAILFCSREGRDAIRRLFA